MSAPELFDRRRRTLLAGGGTLAVATALRTHRALAQGADAGKMRIGIIGSGHIGGTIGGLWVKAGHPVLFSSRHPEELKDLVAGLGPLAQAGTVEQAIAFGDVLFIAVPYGALPQIGQDYGDSAQGQDRARRLQRRGQRATAPSPRRSSATASASTSQKYLPGTRLVRAFNTLSYKIFAREANRPDPKLAVPIAGDDRRSSAGRGRTGARCRLRSGGGRQAGGREPLPARRAGLRPGGERGRTQAEAVAGAMMALAALACSALVPATPQERAAALWSFAYFFTLLAGYYVLRPLRDQMGIAGGVRDLPWLFTATFVSAARGAAALRRAGGEAAARALHPDRLSLLRRQPRAVLAVADARRRAGDRGARVFRLGQRLQPVCGRGVLVVHGRSVHEPSRASACSASSAPAARRAGCSGRVITIGLSVPLGPVNLLIAAAVLLELAVFCVHRLERAWPRSRRRREPRDAQRIGGSAFAALPELIRSPYLLGVARLGQPALVRRDDRSISSRPTSLRRRCMARRADAHLRRHRSRGGPAQPGDPGLRHRATAQALRHRHRGRRAAGGLRRRLRRAWRWRRRLPSWWRCRWCSAG